MRDLFADSGSLVSGSPRASAPTVGAIARGRPSPAGPAGLRKSMSIRNVLVEKQFCVRVARKAIRGATHERLDLSHRIDCGHPRYPFVLRPALKARRVS